MLYHTLLVYPTPPQGDYSTSAEAQREAEKGEHEYVTLFVANAGECMKVRKAYKEKGYSTKLISVQWPHGVPTIHIDK